MSRKSVCRSWIFELAHSIANTYENVNVYTNVDFRVSHPLLELLHDPISAQSIEISRRHDLEPASLIMTEIGTTEDWRSDTGMRRGVEDQTLLMSYV